MKSANVFSIVFLCVTLPCLSFELYLTDEKIECKPTGIQCTGDSSFTTCSSLDNLSVLSNIVLHCPDTYFCDDSTDHPCVLVKPTTELPTTTASPTTRKPPVPRPTGPPTCEAAGLHPAPACNQYYECVEKKAYVFWTYYEPELRTCAAGGYFDTGNKKCLDAELSDCPEPTTA
ncbi:unnamed protein product [Phyllotreta striolata]|uniref:Chitin-binding type-2 domain-containing protein n=1 Tax=Phyllotreta striolata TaxID=444603 RepID=A0A9N9TRP8_PHYSR|nr:unnamed protein product [Phyllotreta striolata]